MGIEMIYYCIISLLLTIFIMKILSNKYLPPSPLALPIIGHLHLLKKPLHRTLQILSNKYGPILYLRFGFRPVLIVSSPSTVEQCLSNYNDAIFANRPEHLAKKHLGKTLTVLGWANYGDEWRNLRRSATVHIFSSKSLQTSSHLRNEEIRFIAHQLLVGGRKKVNLKTLFFQVTYNVITRMVMGTRCSSVSVEENFGVQEKPPAFTNLGDFLPFLKWLGVRGEERMTKVMENRDNFIKGMMDEYLRDKDSSSRAIGKWRKTIVETFFSLQNEEPELYSDDLIMGIIFVMFTAATETSALTMEWAMSLLLNNPEAIQKARIEIENNVEKGCLLDDSDITKLPYLRCIIKETQRLFPVAQLLVPHFSSEECIVGGFKIPKGTILMVNVWAIHRDPNVWEEPDKFKPERFEGNEGDREGYKFIPFGVGRRGCPGAGLAYRLIGMVLGTLIQCFDWERVGSEMVDLTESGGATLSKVNPLEAICTPRPTMIDPLSQF